MRCSVVRAQTRLGSDVIVNVTSPTSGLQRGYVIDAVHHNTLNQSSGDDVITAVPTQQMSKTSNEETVYDSDAAAGEDDDVEDDDKDGSDSPTEQRLMRQLLRRYERAVRPVRNASETVMVRMGLTLTQIFNMVSDTHLFYSPFTRSELTYKKA